MRVRTLMVGCVAGEGHLDGDESSQPANARLLASAVMAHARDLKASLIVLKEFPAKYRAPLACFLEYGFARVPSFPMTRLDINYSIFEEYMKQALNSLTRHNLRRNFRAAEKAPPIEMSVVVDASPIVDDIYPLYLAAYERSGLHFEKLTKEYLCGIGQLMPDKVRFFLWR
jgi:predicted N-acyltransferase